MLGLEAGFRIIPAVKLKCRRGVVEFPRLISVCQSLRSYGYFPFNPRTPEQGDMQRSPVKREWLQNQRFSTELSKFCLCNGFRKSGALRPPKRNCRTSESGWLEGAVEAFGGVCARVPG